MQFSSVVPCVLCGRGSSPQGTQRITGWGVAFAVELLWTRSIAGDRRGSRALCLRRIRHRRRTMRTHGKGIGFRRIGHRRHRTLGIQQMIRARAQSELDERAGIGNSLVLPSMIALKAPHGLLAGLIPSSARFPAEIVLPNERFLNSLCALRINLLLSPNFLGFLPSLGRSAFLCRTGSGGGAWRCRMPAFRLARGRS